MRTVEELRNACRFLVRKPERGRPFKYVGVEGRIVLLWSALAALPPWSIP
jgi:hypothetical protein